MSKCTQFTGTLLTLRSNEYKALLIKEFSENIMSYFEDKKIKPIIDTRFFRGYLKVTFTYGR